MSWSLGTVTNNYPQPVGIQLFAANGKATDFSSEPIRGGNINIIIPLRGTRAFVDTGYVSGTTPVYGIDAFFLDKTWSFHYDTTTKINVTIDSAGNPTLKQV